jgi:prophage regulatory protein
MTTESGLGATPPPANGPTSPFPAPAFLRIRDVLRITALSRPTIYRRIAAHKFPPPIHLGGRACGWPSAALQSWIEDPEGYRAPQPADQGPGPRPGRPRKHQGRS